MNSKADAPSFAPTSVHSVQGELFDLARVEGYGVLTRRERMFAAAIFEGHTQREAARRAGVVGSEEVLDVAGARLIKSDKVRRLLDQAWTRAGADIAQTLREAEEIRRRAYREIADGRNAKASREAMVQWREAATLIASIHGRLAVRVEGQIDHRHGGAIGAFTVPESALATLAQMRREVIVESSRDAGKESGGGPPELDGGRAA
jgi:hypothetical protein